MEDNSIDMLLLAILILIFAAVVNMYENSIDYGITPLSQQTDTMLNKWRRIW